MQPTGLEIQGGALDVVIVARAGFLDLGGGLVQFRLAQLHDGTEAEG